MTGHAVSDPTPDEGMKMNHDDKVCKVVHVSMLKRHGGRYPFMTETNSLEDLRKRVLGSPGGPKYNGLGEGYTQSNAEQLAPLGEQEQFDLARITGIIYNSLLKNKGNYIMFISSTKQRNRFSNLNFQYGLNKTVNGIGNLNNVVNGSLLRFHEDCNRYDTLKGSDDNEIYTKSPECSTIRDNLQDKLGLEHISSGTFV